ncbi:sensor histidine kinase [Streptococcus phocae]|uniref:sensor histidine kinase n=1 Tax=Streptococcus phocae TaxID=119224 RepID=UPI000AE519B2
MIEFNNILLTLYQKDDELKNLLEMEKKDKEDLSFQVAALAHDIKTPLTVLKGNIELLEMTDLDEKQLDFMSSMNHGVDIFEKYFNSMVNYSRLLIEDKDYQEDIDLSEFLDELSLECRDIMSSKKIDFQIVNASQIEVIKGNRLNLDRALLNILSNAIRYCSEEGKVVLSISEDSNFVSFEIWNNGLPFTEEALKDGEKLFYTENKGRNDKHYGIGLSFAQKISMRHQGQLVLSNPQKGGAQVTLLIKNFQR